MSGKELSKLVAFVKGTQFDLVVREVFINRKNGSIVNIFLLYHSTINSIGRNICNAKDMEVLDWKILLPDSS